MTLVKAALQEVGSGAQNPPPTVGEPVTVQLNPASLRYQLANNVDMGKAFGRSASQAQGSSSATLQFDLVFDTADEGTTEAPVDVRTRTRKLEQFLLPNTRSPKSAPPRVKFTYGTFSVIGVMSALNQDFDLFAETGVPLRAKLSVTIKEQKPEFDAGQIGAGANRGGGARPLSPGASAGAPPADRTGTALAGESASDFASRMGLDPSAWKSLAAGLGDTLSLAGGLRIDFSSSLSLGAGLGTRAGATGATAGAGREVSAIQAAQSGGVSRVIEERAIEGSARRANVARAAFAAPAPQSGPAFAAPAPQPRAAGPATQPPSVPAPTETAARRLDRRALSYGSGVPLRPRIGAPDARVQPLVQHSRCGKGDAK